MSDFIVYKLDANGRELLNYPATLLDRSDTYVKLEAFFSRDDMDLGFVVFKRHDRFVEYFYTDRWYNIFAIYDRDDRLFKGWYCNICRPSVVRETAVYCEDLALDLWITPAGESTVLDKDEFAALNLPRDQHQNCQQAVTILVSMAKHAEFPM